MKDILKNFNDEAGFHVEESEQEAEYIDKDGDKNFRKLFKLFVYNAIGGIRRTVPKIGEENIKKLEQIKQDIKDGKIVVKP